MNFNYMYLSSLYPPPWNSETSCESRRTLREGIWIPDVIIHSRKIHPRLFRTEKGFQRWIDDNLFHVRDQAAFSRLKARTTTILPSCHLDTTIHDEKMEPLQPAHEEANNFVNDVFGRVTAMAALRCAISLKLLDVSACSNLLETSQSLTDGQWTERVFLLLALQQL